MCPNHEASAGSTSRRGFLFKLGLVLNAVGVALVGIPVVGYILAPARRFGGQSWVKLGVVDSFPAGQTRLAQYENPFRVPWDGASSKVACWVRRVEGDRFRLVLVVGEGADELDDRVEILCGRRPDAHAVYSARAMVPTVAPSLAMRVTSERPWMPIACIASSMRPAPGPTGMAKGAAEGADVGALVAAV